jgi:hypothetical protein
VYIFAFLLYTVYFCAIYYIFLLYSQKIQIENISVEHPFYMSVAHPIRDAPKLGAPQILCVAHLSGVRHGYDT